VIKLIQIDKYQILFHTLCVLKLIWNLFFSLSESDHIKQLPLWMSWGQTNGSKFDSPINVISKKQTNNNPIQCLKNRFLRRQTSQSQTRFTHDQSAPEFSTFSALHSEDLLNTYPATVPLPLPLLTELPLLPTPLLLSPQSGPSTELSATCARSQSRWMFVTSEKTVKKTTATAPTITTTTITTGKHLITDVLFLRKIMQFFSCIS
jgi:hypothetical protein